MDRRKKTVKTKMFLMAKKKREVIFQLVGSTSKFLVNCSSFAGIKKKKKKKNIYIYIYIYAHHLTKGDLHRVEPLVQIVNRSAM